MHIPTSLALTLSLLTSRQAFEGYDPCAQDCFDNLVVIASQCTETIESQAWIACICQDTTYDSAAASCISGDCGATILNQTAYKHEYNCNLNGSPPALDAQQFVAAAAGDNGDTGSAALSSILSSITEGVTTTGTAYSLPTTYSTYPVPTYSVSTGDSSTPTTTKNNAQNEATQTSSSSSPPATSSTASSSSSSNTLSTGSLVGSIVGSITGAIGSCAGVYFAYKTYKIKKEEKKEAKDQAPVRGE